MTAAGRITAPRPAWVALALAIAALCGCQSPGAPEGSAAGAPEASAAGAPAGAATGCTPVTQRVDGLVIDATECRYATGLWRVRAEPGLPGLALWRDGDRVATVLQLFARGPDDGLESLLPTLRARGHIPDDDGCRFVPARVRPFPRTIATFEIRPTGERLRRFQATPADQIPDPPCGAMGWSTHGVRYFVTDLRRPDRVLYIDEGQDGTQIDPGSLRWEDAGRAPGTAPAPR